MNTLFPEINKKHTGSKNSSGFLLPRGYGSSIICSIETVRKFISAISDQISSETDLISRHNLFAVYTYLCAEFSFALRPRNRPNVHIDYKNSVTIVQDKQSMKFYEQRILPLPHPLSSLLVQMRDGFKGLKFHIGKILYTQAILYKWDKHFFLINKKSGRKEDFMLTEMKKVLAEFGIPLAMPPNFPRHFVRNYLYRAGIANDLIDAWVGHQHFGREMMNITAGAMPQMALKECFDRIEVMLAELGFRELKYISKGGI